MKEPSLQRLLGYQRHLEGSAFTRKVLAVAARRRHQRNSILMGAAVAATVVAIALMPDKFTFLSNLHLSLQGVGESMAALPTGGVPAMLLVSLLVMGTSKCVNSI